MVRTCLGVAFCCIGIPLASAEALFIKFSDAPLPTKALVLCSFPSVHRICTLIMIFSLWSYLAVYILYGGSGSATGFSLRWLLPRPVPEGCCFPPVLLPEFLLHMWLLWPYMAICRCFSRAACSPERNILRVVRNCNILVQPVVRTFPRVILQTCIFR